MVESVRTSAVEDCTKSGIASDSRREARPTRIAQSANERVATLPLGGSIQIAVAVIQPRLGRLSPSHLSSLHVERERLMQIRSELRQQLSTAIQACILDRNGSRRANCLISMASRRGFEPLLVP